MDNIKRSPYLYNFLKLSNSVVKWTGMITYYCNQKL